MSIDGLQPEHDERRKPATYDRILKHIEGHQITVHCTVTRQQVRRAGYLEEFVQIWSANPNTRQIWISLYTPQIGEISAERLTPADRAARGRRRCSSCATRYPKLQMPKALLERLRRSAGVARRVHLRADDRVRVGGLRRPRSRRASSAASPTAAVRVHGVGGARGGRPAPPRRQVAIGSIFNASFAVGGPCAICENDSARHDATLSFTASPLVVPLGAPALAQDEDIHLPPR